MGLKLSFFIVYISSSCNTKSAIMDERGEPMEAL